MTNAHMLLILQAKQENGIMTFLPIILIGVVFYFFMIRPQSKRQKQEKLFQENLSKGKKVVTTSGLHGKISEINSDSIILETLAGKLKIEKTAISKELSFLRYPAENEKKEESKKNPPIENASKQETP